MTKLPATYLEAVEADARKFARDWIAQARTEDWFRLGHAALDPAAGRALLRRTMKQYALAHPFNMAEIVDYADQGWDDADLALCELAAEFIDSGRTMPATLAAYTVKQLHPGLSAKPHGKKKATNWLQDVVITTLIGELVERFKLKPTRSQIGKKRRESACSIVAAELAVAEMHRGDERAIQQIWLRFYPAWKSF